MQDAIERAAGEGGRTVIAVAHRLATIQKADTIFVLGSGMVLERGDHQGLLRKRGVYWQMVSSSPTLQFWSRCANFRTVSSSSFRPMRLVVTNFGIYCVGGTPSFHDLLSFSSCIYVRVPVLTFLILYFNSTEIS